MKLSTRVCQKVKTALILSSAGLAFSPNSSYASPVSLKGYVMQVQMTPAVCVLDVSKKKQRKCLEGYSLTITGLMPEISARDCSTRSSAKLSPLQAQVVARVMPDESARSLLWSSIGGCTPLTASQYFRDIINKAENLKIPADLRGMENKSIQLSSLKTQFFNLNPRMPREAIRFNCQNHQNTSVLTGIQICYTAQGPYKQCSNQIVNSCPGLITIRGAY